MHSSPVKGVVTALVLVFFGSRAWPQDAWMIGVQPDETGSRIVLNRFQGGTWSEEDFTPGSEFSNAFFPSLGWDPGGILWAVWAGRRAGEPPGIYCSRRGDAGWNWPERVDPGSRRWDNEPAIAFTKSGEAVVAWSGLAGKSTEIFAAGRRGGSFSPPVTVSAPDDSPDVRPVLGRDEHGEVILLWEGWADGRARVFWARRAADGWSSEEPVSPRSGVDQILPGIRCLSSGRTLVTWREDGAWLEQAAGKTRPRRADTPPEGLPPLPSPPPDIDASLLYFDPPGNPVVTRCRDLLPPTKKAGHYHRGKADLVYYIGYGDSITYGHDSGGDGSRWYGSILAGLLDSLPGNNQFHLYNRGYPGATTSDLLNGGGDWGCPGIESVMAAHPAAEKILIMGGTNDIKQGVALPTIKYYLGVMIDRARNRSVEPVLGTIIPRVDHTPYFTDSTNLSTNYIPALAGEKQCRLADPYLAFMAYYPGDYFWYQLYGDDLVHPRWPDGDNEIAGAWLEVFTPQSPVLDSGDYDGDGSSEIAIFRSSTGLWAIRGITRVYFGREGDLPASGDYNGDGSSDIALFRPSTGLWAARGTTRVYFGGGSDIPVPGDYNGDGTSGPGIFRPSAGLWAVRSVTRVYFGREGDLAVPVYGSGPQKLIGIFRDESGLWAVRGVTRLYFGGREDRPVAGNYHPDPGQFDPAVFRGESGLWAVRGMTRAYFGRAGDQPATGNFDGFLPLRPSIFREENGLWAVRGVTRVYFGRQGDIAVSGISLNPSSAVSRRAENPF